MKSLILTSVALAALMGQAQALTLSITTSQTLPDLGSIIAPTPTSFSGWSMSTADVYADGALIARSPFESAPGYESAPFSYVTGGLVGKSGPTTYATYTKTADPTFVTGGDSFTFIFGSPDGYNTVAFFKGGTEFTSFTGGDPAFTTKSSGYYVTTVSGLTDYDEVQFSSTQDSLEYATFNVSSVPLPASLPLFGAGLLGLGAFAWANKRAAKRGGTA